jgi:hypothetical protein
LPLVPGVIELVTAQSVASGRHAGLQAGRVAVLGWPGQPADPKSTHQGVKWMYPGNWTTYQRTNFVTPAFPGYVSGHSSFSRSAAEVLTAITGSPFFPGGLATYTAPADTGLGFEKGPSKAVQLQWATYYDAADQAGLSRIWGGIHPPVDDFGGLRVGSTVGKTVWDLVQKYWNGTAASVDVAVRRIPGDGRLETSYSTRRGFNYRQQSTTDLRQAFANDAGTDVSNPFDIVTITHTNAPSDAARYFRIITVP